MKTTKQRYSREHIAYFMCQKFRMMMVASVVIFCVACATPQKSNGVEYYDSKVGKNPSLEEIYEVYQPELESMLVAREWCEFDVGDSKEYCNKLRNFYTNEKRMQLVSYVEDLAEATENSPAVKSNLENLSDLMLYRARFLATETVNENYGIGEDRVVHLERIIKYMIEELESSPVNSRRHQKYSEKAIPLLQRANFEDSWMREMEQLKR